MPSDRDHPDDAELAGRCRRGDGSTWGLLVKRYQRLVEDMPRLS